jgi:hypothetical protein
MPLLLPRLWRHPFMAPASCTDPLKTIGVILPASSCSIPPSVRGFHRVSDLNMTKIESRPLHGKPWEYLFYLDFLDKEDDPKVQNALRHLGELADFMRVLGTYPKGS